MSTPSHNVMWSKKRPTGAPEGYHWVVFENAKGPCHRGGETRWELRKVPVQGAPTGTPGGPR